MLAKRKGENAYSTLTVYVDKNDEFKGFRKLFFDNESNNPSVLSEAALQNNGEYLLSISDKEPARKIKLEEVLKTLNDVTKDNKIIRIVDKEGIPPELGEEYSIDKDNIDNGIARIARIIETAKGNNKLKGYTPDSKLNEAIQTIGTKGKMGDFEIGRN